VSHGRRLPSNGGGNNDLVVTTLAGDLFVFDITSPTTFQQDPMYRTWVVGGLGLYNSLVITDLDDSTEGNELYAAGSIGIRKWRRP
jgi:hypothetical protein